MSDTWRVLVTPAARGAWNMAVDEAILEHVSRGESLPTLRLYAWDPPCLSLGSAQPFADVDMPRLSQRAWDLVRRPTGGRAILHTDELTYSVIAPSGEPRVAGSVLESYSRLAGALVAALKMLEVPVEMNEHAAGQATLTASPVCFEVPSAYEITAGGRKVLGSAQARKQEVVLQHGSLPLIGDLRRITDVLVFSDETARQQAGQRLLERAATLESVLGRPLDWETAARSLRRAFELQLALTLESGQLSAGERARAEALVAEKYAAAAWTERV